MSDLSNKVNAVMLQALLNFAEKYKCKATQVKIHLSLNESGELNVRIVHPGSVQPNYYSLSQVIGTMPAMMAKGRIKRMLLDLEKELSVKRHVLYVLVTTVDQQNVLINVYTDGQQQKELCMADIIK